jgi:drug/metabolite transporter (DMT)-like permease
MKMRIITPLQADLGLLLATFFWGSSFIPVKTLMRDMPPYEMITIRFFIAGLMLLPFMITRWKQLNPTEKTTILKASFFLSIFSFVGFAFQTIGIQYTTATNAAFVTGLNIVFVPMLLSFLGHQKPGLKTWLCILVALVGLGVFSIGDNWTINYGDFLVFICAIVFAVHVIYTSRITLIHNPLLIAGIQFLLQFVYGLCFYLFFDRHRGVLPNQVQWMSLLYLSIFSTCATGLLQSYLQKHTDTSRAAIIYVMEPVFAAILGYFILGEILNLRQWIGGGMILISMILAELSNSHPPLISSPNPSTTSNSAR